MVSAMAATRIPAVADIFYPAEPKVLRNEIGRMLAEASGVGPIPKALIVPHAAYRYSGPVAASAYALLKPVRSGIERVVLLGPSHRVAFEGLATSTADRFATPLGDIPIDRSAVHLSLKLPEVCLLDVAHQYEHSLEVQLPFLQVSLECFSLVPFSVGQTHADEVAELLDELWGGDETLIVISSDLSHYHDYCKAQLIDRETTKIIEQFHWHKLDSHRACGFDGIRGLLQVARKRGLQVNTVDVRNSGDTFGAKDQVVGYGSYVIYKE